MTTYPNSAQLEQMAEIWVYQLITGINRKVQLSSLVGYDRRRWNKAANELYAAGYIESDVCPVTGIYTPAVTVTSKAYDRVEPRAFELPQDEAGRCVDGMLVSEIKYAYLSPDTIYLRRINGQMVQVGREELKGDDFTHIWHGTRVSTREHFNKWLAEKHDAEVLLVMQRNVHVGISHFAGVPEEDAEVWTTSKPLFLTIGRAVLSEDPSRWAIEAEMARDNAQEVLQRAEQTLKSIKVTLEAVEKAGGWDALIKWLRAAVEHDLTAKELSNGNTNQECSG